MNYCTIDDLQQFINKRKLLTSIQKSSFDLEEKVFYVKGIYVIGDVYTNSVHVSECYINKDSTYTYYNYGEYIEFETTPRILRYSDDLKAIIHFCNKLDLLDLNVKCKFDSTKSEFNFEIFSINRVIKYNELIDLQVKYKTELQTQKAKQEEKDRIDQQERVRIQKEKERREQEDYRRKKSEENFKTTLYVVIGIGTIIGVLYWVWMTYFANNDMNKFWLICVVMLIIYLFSKK